MSANDAADFLAPAAATFTNPDGTATPRAKQFLIGAGATEEHNPLALREGAGGTIVCGASAIRVAFAAEAGLANQVTNPGDLLLLPGGSVSWKVTPETAFVYAEADAGGVTAFDAIVWQSSPGDN